MENLKPEVSAPLSEQAKPEVSASSLVSAKSKLVVVGIGNIGINALIGMHKRYDPRENPFLGMLAVEPNLPVLRSCFAVQEGEEKGHLEEWREHKERFGPIQLGENGLGAGGDPALGEKLAKERLPQFNEFIANYDHAVFIGGGGGGSVGAMPVFASAALEAGKTAYALLAAPRTIEGPKKTMKAKEITERMLGICPTMRIQNEKIPNKKLTHSAVFKEINENSLFWVIWLLKSMLQDRGDVVDLDGNDWRTATATGNHTVAGFYDASKGFDELEKGLLGNPYLEVQNVEKATWVGFWCKGAWTIEECEKVDTCIRKKMRKEGRDEEVEFKWGVEERGVPDNTKTIGFVSFAKEGPDSTEEKKVTAVAIPLELAQPVQELVNTKEESVRENHNSTDDIPVPVNGAGNNGNGVPAEKVSLGGLIRGRRVESFVTPELAREYNSLFSQDLSMELYARATEVQEKIKQQTGLVYDVPVRPTRIVSAAWMTSGGNKTT
jgi:cell division GTPase FtsZ